MTNIYGSQKRSAIYIFEIDRKTFKLLHEDNVVERKP